MDAGHLLMQCQRDVMKSLLQQLTAIFSRDFEDLAAATAAKRRSCRTIEACRRAVNERDDWQWTS